MKNLFEVPQDKLIAKIAEQLIKISDMEQPDWAAYVKTGVHKERPPADKDWWYTRAAAVLRTVVLKGPIGVSKLRTKYGGRQRRGHKKAHFKKGSGSILRKILQQLDKAGFTKKEEKDIHRGRVATGKGRSLVERAAKEVARQMPKPVKEGPRVYETKETQTEAPKQEVKETPKAEKKPEVKEVPKVEKSAEKPKEVPKQEVKEAPKVEKKEEVKEKPKEEKKEVPKEEKKEEVKEQKKE